MAFGYVYYVKNEINGMMYIGKTTIQALVNNPNYRGSGTRVAEAVKEYGVENFSIHLLAEAKDGEELTFLEKFYLMYYKIPNEKFYNVNLATSNSGQVEYFNKNNAHGANLKDIVCFNIKDNSQIVFSNMTEFCKEHKMTRGCVFNVMTGQRLTHKDCIFWYKDFPLSDDGLNWILNYKNKTHYQTKYFKIDEVKAELNYLYRLANNKLESFTFHGYFIEDGKEIEFNLDKMRKECPSSGPSIYGDAAPRKETKIEDRVINTTVDTKFEQERDTEYKIVSSERTLYFNYDEILLLENLYPDINIRLLRQALNRGQKSVMSGEYNIHYLRARSE